MNEPLKDKPSSSIYVPNSLHNLPAGSANIGYLIFLIDGELSCQALWTKTVSVLTLNTAAPAFLNSSYKSANSTNSVGQINVKSAICCPIFTILLFLLYIFNKSVIYNNFGYKL